MYRAQDVDSIIREVIVQLFPKFDRDNKGTLAAKESEGFFNQAFQRLGVNIVLSSQEAMHTHQRFDKNFDGQISKEEAHAALKELASRSPVPGGQQGYPGGQPWQAPPNNNLPNQQNPYQNNPYQNQWNSPPQNAWGNNQMTNPWNNMQPGAPQNPGQWGQNHVAGQGGNSALEMRAKQAVDQLFLKYDYDRSGSLDVKELANVFNEILSNLRIPIEINQQEAMAMLREIDKTNDGRVQKPELYICVKNLMDMSPPSGYY